VSISVTRVPSASKLQIDEEIVTRRARSSGWQFMNDEPSSTLPRRLVTPAAISSESASVVFPSPP
jgi:hypothetical protein